MELIKTKLDGVFIIKPQVFGDSRGYFMETWSKAAFEREGFDYNFVQDNQSFSAAKGTLRGIHFQRGDAAPQRGREVVAAADDTEAHATRWRA